MKVFLIIATLFSPPNEKEYDVMYSVNINLRSKFTYISDYDKWGVEDKKELWNGESDISADCEEYAFGASAQLEKAGVKNILVLLPNHLIACGETWCIDNNHVKPFLKP